MLPVLRLSSGPPVHRGTIAGRAAFTSYDLWIVLQNACDDRMAIGLWARAEALDSVDAQGAKPFDLERKFDDAEGCGRSCDRAARLGAFDDRRIPAAARLDSAGAERDRRHRVLDA